MTNGLNTLERSLQGTGSSPLGYMIGSSSLKSRRIRRAAQDYEEQSTETENAIKEGNIDATSKGFLKIIRDLDKSAYNIQLTEIRAADRVVKMGKTLRDFIKRYKGIDLKSLNKFIKVFDILKKLTKKNWDTFQAGLKGDRKSFQLMLEDKSIFISRTAKRRAMEIEEWRRKLIDKTRLNIRVQNKIKSAISAYSNAKKADEKEKILNEINEYLNTFSLEVYSELNFIRKIEINIVILFLDLDDRLNRIIKMGFPTDSPDYQKIVGELDKTKNDLYGRSKIAAFRIAGNVR